MKKKFPSFELNPPWRSLPLVDGRTLVFGQNEAMVYLSEAVHVKEKGESDLLRLDLYLCDSQGRELRSSSLVNGIDLWKMLGGNTAYSESRFFNRMFSPPSSEEMLHPIAQKIFYGDDSRTIQVFRVERDGAQEDPWSGLVFSYLNKHASFYGLDIFLLVFEAMVIDGEDPDEEPYVPSAEIVLVFKMSPLLKSVDGTELADHEKVYLPISPTELFWKRNVLPGYSALDPAKYTWMRFLPVPVFGLTGGSGEPNPAVQIVDERWEPIASMWEESSMWEE